MKKKVRRIITLILVMTLVLGAIQTGQVAFAQTAKKLSEDDFKFTGKYKSAVNHLFSKSYNEENELYWLCSLDTADEKNPAECLKTSRGITLTSTKQQVFKAYGKAKMKKISKKSKFYQISKKDWGKKSFALLKENLNRCVCYSCKWNDDTVSFRFFFNKENKVEIIAISKNL